MALDRLLSSIGLGPLASPARTLVPSSEYEKIKQNSAEYKKMKACLAAAEKCKLTWVDLAAVIVGLVTVIGSLCYGSSLALATGIAITAFSVGKIYYKHKQQAFHIEKHNEYVASINARNGIPSTA